MRCSAHSKPLINIDSLPLVSSGMMLCVRSCHPWGSSFPRLITCTRGSGLFSLMNFFTLWEEALILSVSGPSSRNCPTKPQLFPLSCFLHLPEDYLFYEHPLCSLIRPPFPCKDHLAKVVPLPVSCVFCLESW